jgi:hypothetical protein
VANEWNKTAFVEFETMLRRHLRSGAAPVAACAGFDLDAASAYLEGALDEWRRASYESHLAGCAICRRHLIELTRLAQAAPSFEARPAATPDRMPAWDRWKEAVAGWFDLSNWNLKWQIAGATGAAFAILIAALGVQSLRRAPSQAEVATNNASAAAPSADELIVQPLPSPSPEPPSQASAPGDESLIALRQQGSQVTVPRPLIGPTGNPHDHDHDVAALTSRELLMLSSSQPAEAPPAAKPGGVETSQSPPPQPRVFPQINDLSRGSGSVLDFRDELNERPAEDITQSPGITPPRYRAPLVESKSEPRPKPGPRSKLRVLPEIKLWSLTELAKRSLAPFSKSDSGMESERKAKSDKQEASDDETSKPMLVMIRGKVFDFKKGMLIDREYKPEMQKWNVWAMKQGDELYKRTLANEPLLKEFFDQAPILIVWRDRIYKVLK